MSRVEGVDPMKVRIGQRVRLRVSPKSGDEDSFPLFVAEGGA
jgi:uncharacterized OB-fold protein